MVCILPERQAEVLPSSTPYRVIIGVLTYSTAKKMLTDPQFVFREFESINGVPLFRYTARTTAPRYMTARKFYEGHVAYTLFTIFAAHS